MILIIQATNRGSPNDTTKIVDLFGNSIIEDEISEEQLSDTLIGRYAEFMVCAQITKAGYNVTHVDGTGFDLIITLDEGTFTIQVRSTRRVVEGKCTWSLTKNQEAGKGGRNTKRGTRALTSADADLLALFHHRFETTVIIPLRKEMSTYIALPLNQVENASIEETLKPSIIYLLDKYN